MKKIFLIILIYIFLINNILYAEKGRLISSIDLSNTINSSKVSGGGSITLEFFGNQKQFNYGFLSLYYLYPGAGIKIGYYGLDKEYLIPYLDLGYQTGIGIKLLNLKAFSVSLFKSLDSDTKYIFSWNIIYDEFDGPI